MKNNMPGGDKEKLFLSEILVRLDILLKMLIRKEFIDDKNKFKLGEAVSFLKDTGLEANDIAKLVGKNNSKEISVYLYSKK